nr:hypothetical protein [Tanacetum cinerariifolium]
MALFDYRLNPLYPIKECSYCGALYTMNYCCSDGSLGDKIICDINKIPDLSQRPTQNCPKCGNPVDGHYCQGCALLYSGENSLQSPPQINHHCCYGCGDSLEDIFCHKCTYELCGKGAHYGYNCPPKVPIVPDLEPFNNQTVDELPQTVPSSDPTCYSKNGNSFTYDSRSNLVHDSPNVFSPPLQPLIYSYEFCGDDAYYGYDCSLQFPVIHQPIRDKMCAELLAEEQEANINIQPFQYSVVPQTPQEEIKDILELFQRLHNDVQNIHEKLAVYINTPSWDRPTICYSDDDDEDNAIAVTPSLSIEEPDNSLSMGDEHLDTITVTKSEEFIKSSVESLVPIPSESEGIPDNMCDVPFHDNSPPLDVSKDQSEDFSDSNDESTLIDNDFFSIDNIEYVEASPPDSELVSSEVMEIVISRVGGIDDNILLTIKDDILREKLLNVNLLIANIEALKDNPTPSSDFMTKSSSTSLNSLSEETNTFDNSLPESETFCFDLEEISSGSTTTRSDISLSEYEAFYDDHVKEISSGSTTTHSNCSFYDSFIFDLLINPFSPAGRSDFYEFANELAHIISLSEYDCFYFKNEPNSRDFTIDVVEDIFLTRELRVHNALPTHPNRQLNLDFILSGESLFTYVVWIFLPFLSYSVAPQYLLTFGNEDTIFDPGICSYHISSCMPDVAHQSGAFIKFNVLNRSPMEITFFTYSPMDQLIRGRVRLKTQLTKTSASCIPGNLKTHAEGFGPPDFISSASIGNHVPKSNRASVYLMAYLINGLRFT